MADYKNRGVASYSNLLAQTYTSIGIAVFCLAVNEGLRRIPRRRAKGPECARPDQSILDAVDRSLAAHLVSDQEADAIRQLKSRENWIAGYLYLGRCFSAVPSPPHPRIPLAWILQVLKVREDRFLALAGVDAAVYLRFLRGCLFFVTLHTFTTLVILLPIHLIYGEGQFKRSDINRGGIASINYLHAPPKVARLLWVHMGMLFWITATWIGMLAWLLRGVLRMRAVAARNAPVPARPINACTAATTNAPGDRKAMRADEKHPEAAAEVANTDPELEGPAKDYSVRSRTLLVTNIPQYMRTEEDIRAYFRDFLSQVAHNRAKNAWYILSSGGGHSEKSNVEMKSKGGMAGISSDDDLIEKVTIVRKLSALAELCEQYEKDLEDLEQAHIQLARNVMTAVRARVAQVAREKAMDTLRAENRAPWWLDTQLGQWYLGASATSDQDSDYYDHIDNLVETMQPFMENANRRDEYYSSRRRLKEWLRSKFGHSQVIVGEPATQLPNFETNTNIWDVLLSLPREILAPYQPQTRTTHGTWFLLPFNMVINALHHLFRPHAEERWIETLPTIDLVFSRLEMHARKIDERRSQPDETIAPASSAFVTFYTWQGARRAARNVPHHPWRPLTCVARLAPQYEDIDWRRLVKGKFTAQFLRDWFIGILIWLFQIFWVIPIQAAVALFSGQRLKEIIPGLNDFFKLNPRFESFLTGLVPTFLVVLLGLLIPIILFAIGRKLQTTVTWSELHSGILQRYYKWAILNLVIFFCIGSAAFWTFLQQFKSQVPSPFNLIATSFPAAAPFYAGFFILQTSTQSALQLGLIGLPILQYIFSTHDSKTPRARFRGTRPRTIDYHYWLPNHLVAVHIVVIFGVLNPLVIPFAVIYFAVANVVFRNQFLHVYARRLYEGNGKMLAIRIMRYSLDGLGLAQMVFLAFNLVRQNPDGDSKESDKARAGLCGSLFGITMIAKVVGTRVFRSRFARLEDAEFARIAGQDELFPNSPVVDQPTSAVESQSSPTSPTEYAFRQPAHRRHSTDDIMHFRTPTAAKAPLSLLPWQASFSASANPIDALRRPRHRRHLSESPSLAANIAEEDSESLEDGGGPGTPGSYNEDTASRHGGLNKLIKAPKTLVKRLLPSQRSTGPTLPTRDFMGSAAPTCAAVTLHPPVIPWDDTPDSSMKYETPYYDPLPSALWLPRDPFISVMDLDDTVELHRVLMSTVHEEHHEPQSQPESNLEISFNIPQSHSPPPISVDSSAITGGSEEGGESAPLSQSPAPLSGVPSQDHLSATQSVSSHARRASVSEMGERNRLPLRRPSIAEALHVVSPSPRRRITSAHSLVTPSAEQQPMGHGTLLAGIRGSRRGDTISVAGVSAFSRRSSGHSMTGRNRPRKTSIQMRTAIEARVREESQREDESRRLLERNEALEDQEAERGATTVRWNTLKRLISVRAPARD